MIIVHGENSTVQPVWHPNPTVRGTLAIYQTCIVTIFLCVWTTIHLNVPPPAERRSTQLWRKIFWALLAILIPESAAMNACFQYRAAKSLMQKVNSFRPPTNSRESFFRRCLNTVAFTCFAPVRILDWARRLVSLSREERDLYHEAQHQAKMESTNLTWTMAMAFFVLSGGCDRESTHMRLSLLVLLQCVARLSDNLAISLLELNTFAHCISTLFFYWFWWGKPYGVESHIVIESPFLDLLYSIEENMDRVNSHIWVNGFDPVLTPTRLFTYSLLAPSGDGSEFIPGWRCFYASVFYANGLEDSGNSSNTAKVELDRAYHGIRWFRVHGTALQLRVHSKLDLSQWTMYTDEKTLATWQKLWHLSLDVRDPIVDLGFRKDSWDFWFGRGAPNMIEAAGGFVDNLVMAFSAVVYGGLHLLAWECNLGSDTENVLWKTSSVMTASTGIVLLLVFPGLWIMEAYDVRAHMNKPRRMFCVPKKNFRGAGRGLIVLGFILIFIIAVARAFLVIESFKALSNSPPSTYTIPNWSAYVAHI
ncbi:hypothetical protein Q7P37_005835 [Cladosporium fusiforme]